MPAITVTAAQSGTTFNGIQVRLKVLLNAALAGSPATAVQSASAAHQASITTTLTGSLVYGALVTAGSTAFTAAASSTLIDNFHDTSNSCFYGSCVTTSPTGTPGAVTAGATLPPSGGGGCALLEVLPSGGSITDDTADAPAVAEINTAHTVTTAPFTPPPGSLLVALVSADASIATVVTVTDSSGLTWTQQAVAQTTGDLYAGVWTAQVPGGASLVTAATVPLGPGWQPGLPGMPGGTPFLASPPYPASPLPPPPPDLYPATYTALYGGPEAPGSYAASPAPLAPGWQPGLPGAPGGTPFYTPPQAGIVLAAATTAAAAAGSLVIAGATAAAAPGAAAGSVVVSGTAAAQAAGAAAGSITLAGAATPAAAAAAAGTVTLGGAAAGAGPAAATGSVTFGGTAAAAGPGGATAAGSLAITGTAAARAPGAAAGILDITAAAAARAAAAAAGLITLTGTSAGPAPPFTIGTLTATDQRTGGPG